MHSHTRVQMCKHVVTVKTVSLCTASEKTNFFGESSSDRHAKVIIQLPTSQAHGNGLIMVKYPTEPALFCTQLSQ